MRVLVANAFVGENAIVTAAQESLAARDHQVTTLDLVGAGFDRFMSAAERRAYHETDNLVTPEQRESAGLVQSHDALLMCGPVVHGTIAPCLKSWLERVFIPEVAFTFNKQGRVTGALTNIRRVAMLAECSEPDNWAHGRRGSTRSALRGVRMMSTRFCRTTYLPLLPNDDVMARIDKALARW